uniref:Signal transduction histidine kinase n=1 Tax=Cyanothece sp. (strain PCC 7425 / ATCC 29141) TaxID=395961 RepID=B8HWB6_CYAP4
MGKTRILVVEDEVITAKTIARKLQTLGYEVTAIASSGEKALAEVGTNLPDLVLMDIVLKGQMDGIETANEIRQRWGIPIIYLTAYADSNTLERAKQTSPFGYILKPLRNGDFDVTIQMALRKAADEAALYREKTLLVQEVEHQVKNNLQVISSLLNLQINRTTNPDVRAALIASQNRVLAMAIAHQHIDPDRNVTRVTLLPYLRELVERLMYSFAISSTNIGCHFEAPPCLTHLTLSLEKSVPCGIIINELISDILQYQLKRDDPQTDIFVRLQPAGASPDLSEPFSIAIHVADYKADGAEPFCSLAQLSDAAPIGLHLVNLLTEQLRGEFQIYEQDNELIFTLTFLLSDQV